MHLVPLAFSPDWVVGSASFLASMVEFVEAFTIVLVVGITINWKSSLLGTLYAVLALAILVAIFGVTLVQYIPIVLLRLIIGIILVMFGMKWLKKAIMRYSGRKAFHDEEAIYEEEMAMIRSRGESISQAINPFGVVTAFKSVLLEGLEVAFIIVTFGITGGHSGTTQSNSIMSAIIGATAAGIIVIGLGLLVRAPLTKIPENTLKFIVGIMLTSFGTFWGGEGLGVSWPGQDLMILVLVGIYLAFAFVAVQVLRQPVVPALQTGTQD